MRGHDCDKKWCTEAQLQFPKLITGTKLRKYIATVCQVFDLTENEQDWLARHLGHGNHVHREFYRSQENAVELTKVGRLLLAVDQGEAQTFSGMKLKDINIEACLKQSAAIKTAGCKHVAENEVKPKNDARYENCEKIILYKRIIQEMEEKYHVTRENNSLLKEKISILEVELAEKQDLNKNPNKDHDNKVHYIQKLPNSDASDHKTQGQNKTNKPHGNRPRKKEEEENKKARTQMREEEEEITKPKSSQKQTVTITNADVASGIQQTLSTLKMNELHALGETTANSDSNSAWRQAKLRRRGNASYLIGDKGGDTGDLMTVSKYIDLHVTRLKSDTQPDELLNFLKPTLSDVGCSAVKSKFPQSYSSYKVSVKEEEMNKAWTQEVWPKGALVSHFLSRKLDYLPRK
ncbi:hypothetical protein JTB14_011697 [Gonioctena quinquepunctata]|nr:hypothetical protein JTB14_011697 [Gonioctena quinquepunctata]